MSERQAQPAPADAQPNIPAAPAPSRRPGRTENSRQKLFAAAMGLLSERGADAVSVDEIAAAAGVSKGTVYYNFGSKDSLVSQLFDYGLDMLGQRLRVDSSLAPLPALHQMLENILDFADQYPGLANLFLGELRESAHGWSELRRTLRASLFEVAAVPIRRLVDEHDGDLGPRFDTLVSMMISSALLCAQDRRLFHQALSTEELTALLITPLAGYLGLALERL